jgi:hypothetical protein
VGNATTPANGRQGVQEIFADEAQDEARGTDEANRRASELTSETGSALRSGALEGVLIL